jgi:heat-inducible transcriptional repressor
MSAGRVPTTIAIKLYVNTLLEEKQLSVTDEVKVKQRVWDARGEIERLMREATQVLATQTHMLAVAATDQGRVYSAGYANILEIPEFFDIDVTKNVLLLVDHVEMLMDLFGRDPSEEALHLLVGDDFGIRSFFPVSMMYTRFTLGNTHGALGVMGPSRMDYGFIRPTLRYMRSLLDQIGSEW